MFVFTPIYKLVRVAASFVSLTSALPLRALCVSLFVGLGLTACATSGPVTGLTALRVNEVAEAGANGETVRWGGTIAVINNTEKGAIVEIVSRPLSSWGRPKRNDQTDGRFIAHLDEVLDPEKVSKGMDVTLVGDLTAIEKGTVGEMPYEFPVLVVSKFRVWASEKQTVPYAYGYWQDPFIKDLPHSEHRPHSALDRVEGQFEF